MSSWIKAACSVRITKATFDFGEKIWSVEGYLDFLGPKGMDLIADGGKFFKHSWYCDNNARTLREMIAEKVGADLFEQAEMWDTLSKSDQQIREDEMERKRLRAEGKSY